MGSVPNPLDSRAKPVNLVLSFKFCLYSKIYERRNLLNGLHSLNSEKKKMHNFSETHWVWSGMSLPPDNYPGEGNKCEPCTLHRWALWSTSGSCSHIQRTSQPNTSQLMKTNQLINICYGPTFPPKQFTQSQTLQ